MLCYANHKGDHREANIFCNGCLTVFNVYSKYNLLTLINKGTIVEWILLHRISLPSAET